MAPYYESWNGVKRGLREGVKGFLGEKGNGEKVLNDLIRRGMLLLVEEEGKVKKYPP